ARYINVAMADPFNFGSFGQGSPQVKFAHSIPLTSPKRQNTMPTLTLSTATKSCCGLLEDRYFILYTTEMMYRVNMVNHIGTWKYTLRMVSCTMGNAGTCPKSPMIILYRSNRIAKIFHQ